jgi:hypothetical protein
MSKMKRIVLGVLAAVIALPLLGAAGRIVFRPAMPSEWHKLHAGMLREEVLTTAAGQHTDMRDLKGFDLFSRETMMLGGSSYWQLFITYDQSGKLMNAGAHFVHRSCGLLSRSYQSVL